MTTKNQKPTDKPEAVTTLAPSPCSAFEAVDATSDEQYFTVGIWLTLEAAIAAIRECGDDYPGETLDEDVKIIEIRERKIGVIDWSETGKVVARFKWERRFDEEVTEWRVTETPNTTVEPDAGPTWCGLKDDPNFVQCCCNCKHLHPVHYHCCTEPKPTEDQKKAAGIEGRCVCGVQKGWACHNPEMDGRIYDNWPQHSCGCECYDPKSPNSYSAK